MATEFQTLKDTGSKRNPVQETRFRQLAQEQGLEFEVDPGSDRARVLTPTDLLRRSQQQAESTLKGAGEKIAPIFESRREQLRGEIEPTKERYQNLLAQLTGQQEDEESRATLATNRELGRRGITSSSGVFDQELNRVLSPSTRFFTGQTKDVGLEQEGALRAIQNAISELSNLQAERQIGLDTSLSGLQASGGANVANLAQQIAAQQQQQAQFDASLAAQQALQQQQLNQPQSLSSVNLGDRVALINPLTGQEVSSYPIGLGPTRGSGGGGINFLQGLLGGNTGFTPSEPKPQFPPGQSASIR